MMPREASNRDLHCLCADLQAEQETQNLSVRYRLEPVLESDEVSARHAQVR